MDKISMYNNCENMHKTIQVLAIRAILVYNNDII